jgi:hypothetical protein
MTSRQLNNVTESGGPPTKRVHLFCFTHFCMRKPIGGLKSHDKELD